MEKESRMELSCENVDKVFEDCLFKDCEDTAKALVVDGIISKFGFNPVKIAEHKEDITSMLSELPNSFRKSGGGGMSFLNACMTEGGEQWGEHRNMELLFCLGIGVGLVEYCMPREMWNIFPGGMPYLVINL